jgi:hypothetical protein
MDNRTDRHVIHAHSGGRERVGVGVGGIAEIEIENVGAGQGVLYIINIVAI